VLPRQPRSLVISGKVLKALVLDGEVPVCGCSDNSVGELQRATGVGRRFGQAQGGGHYDVTAYPFALLSRSLASFSDPTAT